MPERVYKHHILTAPSDVPLLANWLNANGRGVDSFGLDKAIAVAFRVKGRKVHLALATPTEALELDVKGDIGEMLLAVLHTVLIDGQQISLRTRDIRHDLIALTPFFAKRFDMPPRQVFEALAPAFIGDLYGAGDVIGLPVSDHAHFKEIADDAYEVALYGPQYELNIHNHYPKVAVPYARLRAEGALFGTNPARYDWWVDMPDLWLRSLAHFSSDPTLGRALQEGWDIGESFARVLKTSPVEALALLVWQIYDRDIEALSQNLPVLVNHLPANLPQWANQMDLHFPTMVNSVIQMRNAYTNSRAAHTLYGRMLRPGKSSGFATSFRILGSVEDIARVAAVTYWQHRTSHEIMVTDIEGSAGSPHIRIRGEGPSVGKELWRQALTPLANLDNPISIPLRAQVVFA